MSVTSEIGNRTGFDMIRSSAQDKAITFMAERLDRAISRSPIEYETGARERYLELRQTLGNDGRENIPIAISSHAIHADLLALSYALHNLLTDEKNSNGDDALDGYAIPIATSVGSGHQGKLLQKGLPALKSRCESLGIHIIETTRQADQERYGMQTNERQVVKTLRNAVINKNGIAVFPEATVQSGRMKPMEQHSSPLLHTVESTKYKMGELGLIDMPVHGVQQFDEKTIKTLTNIVEKSGNAFFIPVAIDGVNRLVRPTEDRKNRPTVKGIAAIVSGYDLFTIRTRVGVPQTLREIKELFESERIPYTDRNLADFLGFQVAPLLPTNKQGFYAGND